MSDWVTVGDNILNVDNIEFIERYTPQYESTVILKIYMSSGRVIEVTETAAITLWKFIDGERLKFLDLDNPTRDFSGT
jgi:hypothetical protein